MINTLPPGERIHHPRLGYQRLVVGYRDDDYRRWYLAGDIRGGIEAGTCVDCRHKVYLDPGGVKAVKDRDTSLGCMFCNDHFRYVERIHQSGMVTQL